MLVAAFGLPGVMSAWGFAAMRTLMRELLGDHVVFETDTAADLAGSLRQERTRPHVLLCSQYPKAALIDTVVAAGAQPVLFIEDMAESARYLLRTVDRPAMELVRAVSTSAACLSPLRECTEVLIMQRESLGDRPIDVLVAYICSHLGIGFTDAALANCMLHLGKTPEEVRAPALETAAARIIDGHAGEDTAGDLLPNDVHHVVRSVLAPLNALFSFQPMPAIVWPAPVFFQGGRPDAALCGEIDLTGGARCLIYGPYLHLPAGRWAASATLMFGGHVRDQHFNLEVVAGVVVKRFGFFPQHPGLFAARWTFETETPHVPIELRIFLEAGAIEGSLSLVDVAFQPLPDAASPAGEPQRAERSPRRKRTFARVEPRRRSA